MARNQTPKPTVRELLAYLQHTRMEYAYKALLALKLSRSASPTAITAKNSVIEFFYQFYGERDRRGLPLEKLKKVERRVILSRKFFHDAFNTPYALFYKQGFLERNGRCFWFRGHLSPEDKVQVRQVALARLAKHYQEPYELTVQIIQQAEAQQEKAEREPELEIPDSLDKEDPDMREMIVSSLLNDAIFAEGGRKIAWERPFSVHTITREDIVHLGYPRWQAALFSDEEMREIAERVKFSYEESFSFHLEAAIRAVLSQHRQISISD